MRKKTGKKFGVLKNYKICDLLVTCAAGERMLEWVSQLCFSLCLSMFVHHHKIYSPAFRRGHFCFSLLGLLQNLQFFLFVHNPIKLTVHASGAQVFILFYFLLIWEKTTPNKALLMFVNSPGGWGGFFFVSLFFQCFELFFFLFLLIIQWHSMFQVLLFLFIMNFLSFMFMPLKIINVQFVLYFTVSIYLLLSCSYARRSMLL